MAETSSKIYTTNSAFGREDVSTTDGKQNSSLISELEPKIKIESAPRESITDPRTWLVFGGLCLASFCVNLNATILTTVMPMITRDLSAANDYIWINASYNVASAAIQPFLGQACNIFGRRLPMLLSLALFTLGTGLCGGSVSTTMLIIGRAIQGAGSGGVMLLQEVITSDMFPLRERAKYFGIIMIFSSLGVTLGPIIGGGFVKNTTWRWVFYVNLPFGGVAFILAALFLRLKSPKASWRDRIIRIDLIGNAIFISATCSLLLGLIMGKQVHPWSSWRVILPIVLGVIGWIAFSIYQISPYCKEPTIPPVLFSNRTSATGFILVFLSCLLLDWVVYFIPYYFQILKGSAPLRSGAQVLPFMIFIVPAAGVSGFILSKFGQYKPLQWIGFGVTTLAFGLFSTMDSNTSMVKSVFWQLFAAWGLGSLITTILPAIQAPLPEAEVATATGLHAFLRSLGFVWAFTIPSLIFNNRVQTKLKDVISDPDIRTTLSYGNAYSQADSEWITSLSGRNKEQVSHLYELGMRSVWYGALAFSLLGFFLVFVEEEIKLREHLETEFGLEGTEQDGENKSTA
ncbi:MFS general substrate transporter [Lojkania enalia]|uniref:MFS general substrate transporter n=1 Tax=Lojkania enalia TaxID=147567 RepID=A0A9P4K9R9_9PLEO|nr:MFS general substrate transporter [Didymosphaeria enalia]